MAEIANTAEKLAREIRRVTELRCEYARLKNMPGLNVAPVMLLMERALEKACVAAGSGEVVTVIAAINDLEGFTS